MGEECEVVIVMFVVVGCVVCGVGLEKCDGGGRMVVLECGCV